MRFCFAIGVSVALHGLLAVALAVYLEYAPAPDVLATLDLSSVELSFAEKEEDVVRLAPLPPSPPAAARPPPKPAERPPEPKAERTLPPDPGVAKLREPQELPPKVETPKVANREEKEPPREARQAVSAVAQRQARVDAPPRPKRTIRPDYPKGARLRGEQGDVVLEIRVTAAGTVDRVSIVGSCGFAELDEAAVRAVKEARFVPARSGRESVASTARLTLSFKLK